jgi:anti-sigma regulatory factor (Ser/Thr protein kinase)
MSASTRHPVAELTIPASEQRFREASQWLAEWGAGVGVPEHEILRLDLCLNEALANVTSHGHPEPEPIHLSLDTTCDGQTCEASVTVSDAGSAFDASSAAEKTRPASLAEAEPGGLGLVMLRSFSDRLNYHLSAGRNHLSFTVRWTLAN